MNKQLLVFDLDNTLAESKSSLSSEMAKAITLLLDKYKIAVISGGNFQQYEKQLLNSLNLSHKQKFNLFLYPTSGQQCFAWLSIDEVNDFFWGYVYSNSLDSNDRGLIFKAFDKMFIELNIDNSNSFGPVLEDRLTQITYSALGQNAPNDRKKTFDPDHSKRLEMINILNKYFNEYELELEIRSGGSTSIDVCAKGMDKAFGIYQMQKYLNIPIGDMIFLGDAIFPGGNDYSVIKTGIDYIKVENPEDTLFKLKPYIEE